MGEQEHDRADLEGDGHDDRASVAALHEAEETGALAHDHPGERSRRHGDAAGAQQRNREPSQAAGQSLHGRAQPHRQHGGGDEVEQEQRADCGDRRVGLGRVLLQVVQPHRQQRERPAIPSHDRPGARRPRRRRGGRLSHCRRHRSCCRSAPTRTTQHRTGPGPAPWSPRDWRRRRTCRGDAPA